MARPIVVIIALGFLVGRDRMKKKLYFFFILTYILTVIMISMT